MDSALWLIIFIVYGIVQTVVSIHYLKPFKPLTEANEYIVDFAEIIRNTVQDPEAFGSIVDRAAATAILTWKHSTAGELSGDARLASAADQVVQEAISQRILPEVAPGLSEMFNGIMDFAEQFIGEDPRRRQAILNSIMRFAASAQSSGLADSFAGGLGGGTARPKQRWTP